MKIKRLNDACTVSTQIEIAKMDKIARHGFRAILCNRPDGEGKDQPAFAEVADAACRAGLEAIYVPIPLSGATAADEAAFRRAVAALPKPILAYCRSGTRSAMMFARL